MKRRILAMAMIALLLAVMLTACVGYEGKYRSGY